MTLPPLRPLFVALSILLTTACTPSVSITQSTTPTPDQAAQATTTVLAAERDRLATVVSSPSLMAVSTAETTPTMSPVSAAPGFAPTTTATPIARTRLTPTARPVRATATPDPGPPTLVKGEWEGDGTTADGKKISVNFKAEDNAIIYLMISWGGTDGLLCAHFGAARGAFSSPQLPITITSFRFSEKTFGIDGEFHSNTSASGTIKLTDDGSRPPCKGVIETSWEAHRK